MLLALDKSAALRYIGSMMSAASNDTKQGGKEVPMSAESFVFSSPVVPFREGELAVNILPSGAVVPCRIVRRHAAGFVVREVGTLARPLSGIPAQWIAPEANLRHAR